MCPVKQKAWAARLNAVVRRIRTRPEIQKLSEQDVIRIVDEVRRSRPAGINVKNPT